MTVTAAPARFDMGRVISRTFSTIGRNFVPFLLLAFLLLAVPRMIFTAAQVTMMGTDGKATAAAADMTTLFGSLGLILLGLLAMLIGSFVLQAAVIHGTIADLNGRRAALGECLAMGLRKFFPLAGLGIVMFLGFLLGLMLLIVPGLILMIMWVVATPALVVERRGVFDSLSRSADLTRNNRWIVFALLIVVGIISYVITIALTGIGAAIGFGLGQGLSPQAEVLPTLIFGAFGAMASGLISASGAASVYYELRMIKEGVGPEQLASVFD